MKKFIKIILIASIAALLTLLVVVLAWMIVMNFPEKTPNWINVWVCVNMIMLVIFGISHLLISRNLFSDIKKFINNGITE